METANFYDALARDYDAMTNASGRRIATLPLLKAIVDRYAIHTLLDAGCGSGFYTLLFAEVGVEVSAIDSSPEMIESLRKNAQTSSRPVDAKAGLFTDIHKLFPHTYDAVVCLGNTLPHLLTPQTLEASLRAMFHAINPGGVLFLQILNYTRLLQQRPDILNIRRTPEALYVRFYDYEENGLQFNILSIDRRHGNAIPAFYSTPLFPWQEEALRTALVAVGFSEIIAYGSLSFDPWAATESTDMVLLAKKPVKVLHDNL